MRTALFLTMMLGLMPLLNGQQSALANPPGAAPRKHLVVGMTGFELGDPSKSRTDCRKLEGNHEDLPVPLAPQLAKLDGISPLLAWSSSDKDATFEVTIHDDAGRELLKRQVSSREYQLSHPDTVVLQPQRRYVWTVRRVSAKTDGPICSATFQMVPVKERKQVDRELASISSDDPYLLRLVRAQVLTNHRLWYDAIGAYTEAIRLYPDRAEAYEKRATIYAQIEATRELSDADFARADILKVHPFH